MTTPTGLRALEQAKAERNGAHEFFQTQLLQVQEDLTVRGVGGRIADQAAETIAQAADVAREHKGIVAGTMAALTLWFLRGPIVAAIGRFRADEEDDIPERTIDDE